MKKVLLTTVAVLSCALRLPSSNQAAWTCAPDDGAPFGHLSVKDSHALVSFAAAGGVDLLPTLKKVYTGDRESLASVLRMSSRFKSLDVPARVYGNMVYSILLNFGETNGPDAFISVLLTQEPTVRQKIRDILWYPVFCLPADQRAVAERSARDEFPTLWPSNFVFGKDDSVFNKTPNSALYRTRTRNVPGRERHTLPRAAPRR
jgi:hypothetical protein